MHGHSHISWRWLLTVLFSFGHGILASMLDRRLHTVTLSYRLVASLDKCPLFYNVELVVYVRLYFTFA